MSAQTTPSLIEFFRRMEAQLELEPETVQGEIASGVYLMSPRPRGRHGASQGNLFAELRARFGVSGGSDLPPDWLFIIEPEIRSGLRRGAGARRRTVRADADPGRARLRVSG